MRLVVLSISQYSTGRLHGKSLPLAAADVLLNPLLNYAVYIVSK